MEFKKLTIYSDTMHQTAWALPYHYMNDIPLPYLYYLQITVVEMITT
jgi:hypothetical protein